MIPDLTTYNFSVGGAATDSASALSCNAFKKNPGVGGGAQNTVTTYGVGGAGAVLKDAKGYPVIARDLTVERLLWLDEPEKLRTGRKLATNVKLAPAGPGPAHSSDRTEAGE